MKTTELANQLVVHNVTIVRWAKKKQIPGAKRTKGKQWYFPESKAFSVWLAGKLDARSKLQEAEEKQAKQRRKAELLELRHRELVIQEAIRTVKHPWPTGGGENRSAILAAVQTSKDKALSRVFADCAGWMEEACKAMGGPFLAKLRPELRSALLQSLAPLEAIAKVLRG